jgi:hypothetical protein
MYSSTVSSELDIEQWLSSMTGWFNQRTEPPQQRAWWAPEAVYLFRSREKSFLPTRTRTPYHPACGTDTILTMLPRLQKFNSRTGNEGPALAALPLYSSWVGNRTSLDWCRKSSAHNGIQYPDRTVRSESLYPRH